MGAGRTEGKEEEVESLLLLEGRVRGEGVWNDEGRQDVDVDAEADTVDVVYNKGGLE